MSKKTAKAKPPDAPAKNLKDLGLEKYDVIEVHRSELKNAPYNPRRITDGEKEKLKKVLKRHGHVTPITWNKRTGNIVGGHQRISLTDSLAGTDNYRLHVSAIDVDDKREREINVALNNSAAQGDWDFEALKSIFDDKEVTLEGAGFDHTDLVNFFGTDVFNERDTDLADFAKKMADVGATYDAVTKANVEKADKEPFLVFVFPDAASVDAFRKAAGLPDLRYQNGVHLLDRWGVIHNFVRPPSGQAKKRRARREASAPASSVPPA